MLYLARIIRFGLQNFWRNIWLSLVTVLIVALNLFLATTVLGLNVLGQQTLAAVQEKITLSVYFRSTTTDDQAETIADTFRKRSDVASVEVVTRQAHLEQFRSARGNSPLIEDALKQVGENPLGPGLVIAARSIDDYEAIGNALKDRAYSSIIEETGKDYDRNQKVIAKLSGYVDKIKTASVWLTIVFSVIAFLMVFNAIRVTIYTQREEIGIMKLVGASDAFVRGPFILTSVIYGLLAAIFTALVVLPIVALSRPALDQFFAGFDVNVAGYVTSHFWRLLGAEILAGGVLAVVSSIGAIGRYLRV